jgi:Xaa-Pro dipeptidase
MIDIEHMAYESQRSTPRPELDRRIRKFQERLVQDGMDGALIVQRTDLYYFSGTVQKCHLFIPAEGRPLLMAQKSFDRARRESRLGLIIPLKSLKQIPDLIEAYTQRRPNKLGLELDVMPVNTYRTYQELLDGIELLDCSASIRQLRAVKSPYELNVIRRAARASISIYQSIPGLLTEGMSELELAAQLEAITRRKGHQGIVRVRNWNEEIYYGHLMTGESAAVPSFMSSPTGGPGINPAAAQGPGRRPIGAGEPILVDFLYAPDGYLVDQTRIYAIGEVSEDMLRAHQAMLAVQEAIMEAARPGVTGDDIWNLAVSVAEKWNLADHFMGHGNDRVRFVGHGVGLELDELPILAGGQHEPLEAGMVIAVEPKAIFPGRGVVGIENTHIVTADGLERITTYPDQIRVV